MSLYQLQELASRQQEQIESTHRLIVNKEQRLNYLASMQDSQQGPIFDYDQNLGHFKEKLALQEAKIRKLQLLKGQIQKQRCSNSNMCSEVETIKILFKEKERELTVALTKIDALTRQLDELKKGNIVNSYSINGYKHQSVELEKLRQELLHKNKLYKQHDDELIYKRNMLYKKQADMMKIDQKVTELKSRLARKRQLNQQQMIGSRGNGVDTEDLFASKTILRSSMGHPATYKVPYSKPSATTNAASISQNIATVEPLQRLKGAMLKQYDYSQASDYGLSQANKQDSKYQTLPFNTKFGSRNLNANFTSTKQMDESSSKAGLHNFTAMSEDCDSNGVQNGQSANDISLIISHKSDSSKDTSLEERPSPSGSSGSSDRISSSMTAYSYDKMGLNGNSPDNRYFANLDKNYRKTADECGLAENGHYSPKYVPNLSAAAASKSANENGAKECTKSSSALDSFYKTKPSAPVKPIANEGDVVDNCRYDTNFMFNQKSHRSSGENSTLSTPTSGVYSSSEIFSPHDKNGNDLQMDFEDDYDDNLRNQQLEERSSVSEIVSRINNWTVSNGGPPDWEKMKRRPVVSVNEMENELTQEANAKTAAAATLFQGSPSKDKQTGDGKENAKNSPERNHTKCKSEQQDLVNNNSTNTEHDTECTERKELSQKPKRIKGSLKSHDSNRTMKIPLGRRVSFDPLALLLDASLEGELELVKKTSHEVPNPSASNDEGITALHNATCAGHHDIVKYLVEIGCDVNVQDSDGWTPLHCAASCNNIVMIKFLVKSGACIFATTFSDHETAAEKCEEDEEGFDGCSQYLYGVQDQIGSINNGIVYALYDYESQNPDELNFKVGDGIQVLRKGDDQEKEWWWSRIGDYEGYVPRNLIGMYPRIAPSYK